MDDADRAVVMEEAAWADFQRLQAAREALQASRKHRHCPDCGEVLEAHRRLWGVCIECQQERELAERIGVRWRAE